MWGRMYHFKVQTDTYCDGSLTWVFGGGHIGAFDSKDHGIHEVLRCLDEGGG